MRSDVGAEEVVEMIQYQIEGWAMALSSALGIGRMELARGLLSHSALEVLATVLLS